MDLTPTQNRDPLATRPRVMRHRPLPDCRVTGLHYCHSRYKKETR